jgi:hypothetical protein
VAAVVLAAAASADLVRPPVPAILAAIVTGTRVSMITTGTTAFTPGSCWPCRIAPME